MLHMNQQPRYQRIYKDLRLVFLMRGHPGAHYLAGMTIGAEIVRGISDTERFYLNKIFDEARHAKR